MTRRIVASASAAVLALSLLAGTALAGQPNQSCEDQPLGPAGFDTSGFANAEEHYAGEGSASLNANSSAAVSQYDVACLEVSIH
jgi:hypothetical protein